jgi:hypothetical protein
LTFRVVGDEAKERRLRTIKLRKRSGRSPASLRTIEPPKELPAMWAGPASATGEPDHATP